MLPQHIPTGPTRPRSARPTQLILGSHTPLAAATSDVIEPLETTAADWQDEELRVRVGLSLRPISTTATQLSDSTSQSTFAPLSPSEPPRFNGPVPMILAPVPSRGNRGGHRMPNVYATSELFTPSFSTSSSIAGTGAAVHAETPGNIATIRPDETYSLGNKHRSRSHRRPAFSPDIEASPEGPQPKRLKSESVDGNGINETHHQFPQNDEAEALRVVNFRLNHHHREQSSSGSRPASASSQRNHCENGGQQGNNIGAIQGIAKLKKKIFADEHFEIVSRAGEGAGGAVHKVLDKRDNTTYARKTVTTRDSTSVNQVLRELSIISSTSHRNIVHYYGSYMSPSSSEVKIVMEYCDGGSLESISARIRQIEAVVAEKTAGRIAEGIFQGLAYLHSRRTIHRDIKPSNILVNREGIVKLCDFGVSRELTVGSDVGTFTGTLLYMAPERISGGEYSVRSDVWSTGLSLLELVQNKFPFPRDLPAMDVILLIKSSEPPQLEDDPSSGIEWSVHMKDFIRLCLTHNGALRPTPREMLGHPWIALMMQEKMNMARWIRQVWGWPKVPRRAVVVPDMSVKQKYSDQPMVDVR